MTLLDGSGKAPVTLIDSLTRPFSMPRFEELATTEYEFLQPDGAEDSLEDYAVEGFSAGGLMLGTPRMARRYWALRGHLLVGGAIRDPSDGLHLAANFGVTHVLSFSNESTDHGRWSQSHRAEAAFVPLLPPPHTLMVRVVSWVRDLPRDRKVVLYCHCHTGAMQGPLAAYLALRVRWQMDRSKAQHYAGRKPGGDALPMGSLNAIDRAIREVIGT